MNEADLVDLPLAELRTICCGFVGFGLVLGPGRRAVGGSFLRCPNDLATMQGLPVFDDGKMVWDLVRVRVHEKFHLAKTTHSTDSDPVNASISRRLADFAERD